MVASRDRYRDTVTSELWTSTKLRKKNTLRFCSLGAFKRMEMEERKRQGSEEILLRCSSTSIEEQNLNSEEEQKKKKKRVQEKQTKLITMCWVSSEHLDGIWISCARWTIEIPIYFELSVDHLVAGSDWSPQWGDSQPYFAALCCQCWNRKQRYRQQSLSNVSTFAFPNTIWKKKKKKRDWNLRSPISQNKWRSNNIAPFSIIEWYYFIEASCINISASEIYLCLK